MSAQLLAVVAVLCQAVGARAGSTLGGAAPVIGWQEVDMDLKEPHLENGAWSDPSAQPWPAAGTSNQSKTISASGCRDVSVDQGTWQAEADISVQQGLTLKGEANLNEEVAKMVWLDLAVRREPLVEASDASQGTLSRPEQERQLRPMKASFRTTRGGKTLHAEVFAAPLAASIAEAASFGFVPTRAGI